LMAGRSGVGSEVGSLPGQRHVWISGARSSRGRDAVLYSDPGQLIFRHHVSGTHYCRSHGVVAELFRLPCRVAANDVSSDLAISGGISARDNPPPSAAPARPILDKPPGIGLVHHQRPIARLRLAETARIWAVLEMSLKFHLDAVRGFEGLQSSASSWSHQVSTSGARIAQRGGTGMDTPVDGGRQGHSDNDSARITGLSWRISLNSDFDSCFCRKNE